MAQMRKVVLTIEVETDLNLEDLRSVQAVVFGTLRDGFDGKRRLSVKRKMPKHWNHDCRGLIQQVQVNVVK